MIFIPFYEIFPEIARMKSRVLSVTDQSVSDSPPAGTYRLIELYCPDLDCDCRSVRIIVVSSEEEEGYSTLQFGWEDKTFYDRHFGFDDHGFPGPEHPLFQFIGPHGHFFLKELQKLCASDQTYVSQLKSHYQMIKEEAKNRDLLKQVRKQVAKRKVYRKSDSTMKRNDRCQCNSGKKYKNCCMIAPVQTPSPIGRQQILRSFNHA